MQTISFRLTWTNVLEYYLVVLLTLILDVRGLVILILQQF